MSECKHSYDLKNGDAYVYESCEANDTVNVTLTCSLCGHEKTATIGVSDTGVWE